MFSVSWHILPWTMSKLWKQEGHCHKQNCTIDISLFITFLGLRYFITVKTWTNTSHSHGCSCNHILRIPLFTQADITQQAGMCILSGASVQPADVRKETFKERIVRVWKIWCHWLLGSNQQERSCPVSLMGKAHPGSSCQATCHRPRVFRKGFPPSPPLVFIVPAWLQWMPNVG